MIAPSPRLWARTLARTALRWGAIALAVILFLLSLRSAGERAGRMAERLESMENTDPVLRRMLRAATRRPRCRDELVFACATGGFDQAVAVCPPVVECGAMFQARAADELALVPDESAIAEMLSA